MSGHVGIYLRLSRHPWGTDNPCRCVWLLDDDHLFFVSRIAIMAQVTFPSHFHFSGWVEMTIISEHLDRLT